MKKVNINEVARLSGISRTTVSRVINNSPLVKEETALKVKQVMRDLGYQPNELARGLRNNETKTVGVIVSNVLNPFFTAVVRGVEDVANAENYSIILCNTDEKNEKESQYIKMLLGKRVDGLIIASTGAKCDYDTLAAEKPIVFIDRRPPIKEGTYDVILVANQEGSYRLTKHLIAQGYRRIGIVIGSVEATTGHGRLMGYYQALKENNIEIDERLIKTDDFLGSFSYEKTKELLKDGLCDAIYASNNIILSGVLRAMKEEDIKYPQDMGLAAFDDLEWMEYCPVPITAVKQPTYEIGMVAMQTLLKRIAGSHEEPKEISLDVTLTVRDSSKHI